MDYQFPRIETLSDVLPAIEGRSEFIVAEREHFTVVNYVVAMDDTFPPIKTSGGSAKMREEQSRFKAIRRECRGIIFDREGKIVSRRLHKFFNVNERDETLVKNIDFSQPHVILEKLDGSMITPIPVNGEVRWGTKMGLTDVALPVTEWVKNNRNYRAFVQECFDQNETPIFEWCSRKQRIVVDHPEDRLVLIAIRNNVTGEYMHYDEMKAHAYWYNIEIVRAYPGVARSMQDLIDQTKTVEGMEGWVVRFDDGHMVKIKGEWYLRIHKTKDNLSSEKNLIDLIVNENLDDTKAFMLQEDRERVEKFEKKFWNGFDKFVKNLENQIMNIRKHAADKKTFALNHSQTMDGVSRAITFSTWDGDKTVREELLAAIRKNISTQTKVDNIRFVWDNHKWSYGEVE